MNFTFIPARSSLIGQATYQVLGSHTWLVAATLASTGLDRCSPFTCRYKSFWKRLPMPISSMNTFRKYNLRYNLKTFSLYQGTLQPDGPPRGGFHSRHAAPWRWGAPAEWLAAGVGAFLISVPPRITLEKEGIFLLFQPPRRPRKCLHFPHCRHLRCPKSISHSFAVSFRLPKQKIWASPPSLLCHQV